MTVLPWAQTMPTAPVRVLGVSEAGQGGMLVRRVVTAFAIAVCLIVASPAGAISRGDPNDSDSRLDIRLISENADPGTGGSLTIRTFGRWRSRYLRDSRPTGLKWKFDDGDDGDFDLVGKFRFVRGELRFFLRGIETENRYESIRARRLDRRSVRVRFSFDIEELQSNDLSIVATSFDAAAGTCSSDPCRDRAPNSSRMDV
jgi:hypothetical protein